MKRRPRPAAPPPPSWPARPDVVSSRPVYTEHHEYRGEVVRLRCGQFEAAGLHGRGLGTFATEAEARAAVTTGAPSEFTDPESGNRLGWFGQN